MAEYISRREAVKILDGPIQEVKRIGWTRQITELEEVMVATLTVLQRKILDLSSVDIREDE